MTKRLLVGLFVAAVVVSLGAPPARAHAILEASNPGDRARLEVAPAEVTLQFSENVTASLGAIRVFDSASRRVDEGDIRTDGRVVTIALQDGLDDDAYVVTWRVVSADSHPVKGAFTFTVGDAAEADTGIISQLFDSGEDRRWEIAGTIARGLAYGGTLLAAGGAAFLALAHDGGPDRRRLLRVVIGAAAVGAIGVALVLPIQAALATGLGAGSMTKDGVLRQVLGDGVGWSTLVTIAGLVTAIAGTAARRRFVALAGAAIAAASFGLAGHTTETSPQWLVVPADAVHLLAAAAWFGGVVLLVLTLRARRGGDAVATGAIVARFSRLATVTILAVGAAGAALAWSEVRAFEALTGTTYGKVLLVKVVVAALIAGAGAYNHFRLVPALKSAPKKASALLSRTMRIEAIGMVGVLALTAALVNVTPARTAAGLSGPFSEYQPLGDHGSVNLVVDPNRAGLNSMHLYLLDESGRSLDPESVALDLSLPAHDLGPITRAALAVGPGHFQLDGSDLSIAGRWQIDVRLQHDQFTSETATFAVTVNP